MTIGRRTINITVETFLGFRLETGGIIIGWFGTAFHGLSSVVCAYIIYMMYENRNKQAEKMKKFEENYHLFMHGLIFVLLISAAISSYRCVKATKECNCKPFIFTSVWWFIYAMLSFYSFGGLVYAGNDGIALIGLFGGIVFGYFYCITNSLHEKFSTEGATNIGSSQFGEPV